MKPALYATRPAPPPVPVVRAPLPPCDPDTIDPGGLQLEQYPGVHGGVSWIAGRGAYGRCVIAGALVAFRPRPEDDACVYTLMKLP